MSVYFRTVDALCRLLTPAFLGNSISCSWSGALRHLGRYYRNGGSDSNARDPRSKASITGQRVAPCKSEANVYKVRCVRALGVRVRSGFAITVLVDAPGCSWRVLDRRKVKLCPDTGEYARFPFHPLIELEGRRAANKSRVAVAAVRSVARREVARLLSALLPVDAAGVVGGSLADPTSITNPHIRAHAREGRLFREVIVSGLDRAGVASAVLSDRDVLTKVAAKLKCTEASLREALTESGRGTFRPWAADEKLATLGALWQL
jgi:hypothetical protein